MQCPLAKDLVVVRIHPLQPNARMAELAYAMVLEAIQLKVRIFLRVQRVMIIKKKNYEVQKIVWQRRI